MISNNCSQPKTSSMAFGACICPKNMAEKIKKLGIAGQENAINEMKDLDKLTKDSCTNLKITGVSDYGVLCGKLIDGASNVSSIPGVTMDGIKTSISKINRYRNVNAILETYVPKKTPKTRDLVQQTK